MTKTTRKTVSDPSIIRWPSFTAVRLATRSHVFIGHLVSAARGERIEKIEVYRIGRDHYTETFIGYADREQLARLTAPMLVAAREARRNGRSGLYGS